MHLYNIYTLNEWKHVFSETIVASNKYNNIRILQHIEKRGKIRLTLSTMSNSNFLKILGHRLPGRHFRSSPT